ncbi:MAG: hypothetical protein II214_00130, partial [Alistipes sp.]|nr:hypothetical protein [Alistipes sp.]
MEVGFIIDFHRGDETDGADYSTRLRCEAAAGNTVLLPQGSGTLALISDIPSLVGYATQSWVGENFLPKSGGTLTDALTVKGSGSPLTVHRTQSLASVVKFVNTDGNLGWLGVDIDKTAIFMEASSVINKLLHSGNYADYITNSYIKSTLGISDWALASAKPTYTASEVGALSVNGTAQSALKMTPEYLTDLNNATPWRFFDMNTGYGSADGNKPNIAWVSGITGTVAGSSNYRWQLATTTGNARPYFRQESKGNWNNWRALAFTSDIPTKLSQLTDDVVAGNYLSKSGGQIIGEGDYAYVQLRLSGDIATIGFQQYGVDKGVVGWLGNTGIRLQNLNGYGLAVRDSNEPIYYWGANGSAQRILLHSGNYSQLLAGGTINGSITAPSFIGNLTGTADSATKLQTPRTIWGQSFDGTSDITGALTAPSITTNSLTIGGATITYDSVNEALCINGNMYALGGVTAGGAGISTYSSLEARVARLEQQLNIS